MKTKIYFLRDETRFVKYVGMTVHSLEARLRGHIYEATHGGKNHRCDGIREMLSRGLSPTIDLITEVSGYGGKAEMAYIKWLRSKGVDLWNGTDGGENFGVCNKGRVRSVEHRRAISIANTGRRQPPEERRKRSLALKGKPKTLEHAKNISRGKAGKSSSLALDALRKGHLAWKGQHHTPEWKKERSILQTGRKFGPRSVEAKERMSIAQKRRSPPTSETRKKISSAIKEVWRLRHLQMTT